MGAYVGRIRPFMMLGGAAQWQRTWRVARERLVRVPRGPRKRRTREHVIADLSINFVERQALLCGYSAERVRHDYGYDLLLSTYNGRGELEGGGVPIQVKATDRLSVRKERQAVAFRIDYADLRLWLNENLPVILIVYDAQADVAYWLHIQGYFESLEGLNLARVRGTKTVYLPLSNCFNPEAVRTIARLKNQKLSRPGRKGPS